MNDSSPVEESTHTTPTPLERIDSALREIEARREALTPATYEQIIVALEAQRRRALAAAKAEAIGGHPEDEIRLVTVMFMDVVGSTAIAEKIGYEQWRLLIGEAHRRFAETVNQWGGEIGQYLGDGLMCFFGARRSQGNDAARAVSCALVMQQQAAELHFEAQERFGASDFFVRLGVSTGRVVVGTIGFEEKAETLALGTTTVRAARLQDICPPGRVLVDGETQLRVRDEFELIAQPSATLKGFAEPVPNYLIVGARRQTDKQLTSTRIENIEIPFVGRQAPLGKIAAQLQATHHQAATRFLLITGDTGMGKSRILQETARSTQAERFFCVQMVAHYERRMVDYSLVRDMLASLIDLTGALSPAATQDMIVHYTTEQWDSPQAEAAAAIVGYLGRYGFQDSAYIRTLDRSTPDENRAQRHEWVRRWLRGLAGKRPLLLLVDNLQWADPASLLMLRYLLEHEKNLFVLGAARPEFNLTSERYLHDVNIREETLPPLTEAHTRWIINAVLSHVHDVPNDLIETIVERAEGNPLFVEEFLRMLFDNRVIRPSNTGDRWEIDTLQYYEMRDNDHLPNGLLGVFQARLDDLPTTERRVIQAAAVVGQTFWEGAVRAALDMDVREWLDELSARHIISRQPESRFDGTDEYVFRNSLYHDVAYAMLPRTMRMAYHQQVATWLEGLVERYPRALEWLASHYQNADKPLDAIQTYVTAVTHQLEQGQLGEAQRLVESGMEVGGMLPREQALPHVSQLWLLKGETAYAQRNYPEATANSQTALNLMRELPEDDYRERLRAAVTLGNAYTSMGDYEAALDALTEGYQYVSEEQDPAQRATVLRAFGQLFWVRGNLGEAALYEQRALADAETSGDRREIAATRAVLGRIRADEGNFDEALAIFEQIAQLNQQTHNVLYQVEDLLMIADLYHHLFAYEMALQVLDRAAALCERINYQTPLLSMVRGAVYVAKGDNARGLAALRAAHAAQHQNTHNRHLIHLGYLRGLVHAREAEAALTEAGTFIREVRDHSPLLHGRAQLWLGLAQHDLNRAAATESLWSALASETTHGGRDLWLCHYALSIALDDPRTANEHRQQAYMLLSQRASALRNHPDLYTMARNPSHADAIFNRWQSDAGTA